MIKELNSHFVAFIDILGFSEMVKKDLEAVPGTEKYIDKLYTVHHETINLYKEKFNIELLQFSDSIVLATRFDKTNFEDFLTTIAHYQYTLLTEGILVRGGIAYGKHFFKEGFMFSMGLINAYRLESSIARYPRIVVSKDLIDLVYEHQNFEDSLPILKENDGEYFIDYFRFANEEKIDLIKDLTHEGLKQRNIKIKEKYIWLKDYLIHTFPDIKTDNYRFTK